MTMSIVKGSVFTTPFESGCIATSDPDEFGSFLALDSDGVEWWYETAMVTTVFTPSVAFDSNPVLLHSCFTSSETAQRIARETEAREATEFEALSEPPRDFDPDEHALRARAVSDYLHNDSIVQIATMSDNLPVSGDALARVRESLAPRSARTHVRLNGAVL